MLITLAQSNAKCTVRRSLAGQRGLTLLELLIIMVIIAITVSLAAPSFQGTIGRAQVNGMRNNLHSAIQLARSEALRRKVPVSVCASNDQQTCGAQSDWATGWLVFVDTNSNGNLDAGELTINVQFNDNTQVQMYNSPGAFVTYNRNGLALAGAGSYSLCHEKADMQGRMVNIAVTGAVEHGSETITSC